MSDGDAEMLQKTSSCWFLNEGQGRTGGYRAVSGHDSGRFARVAGLTDIGYPSDLGICGEFPDDTSEGASARDPADCRQYFNIVDFAAKGNETE